MLKYIKSYVKNNRSGFTKAVDNGVNSQTLTRLKNGEFIQTDTLLLICKKLVYLV